MKMLLSCVLLLCLSFECFSVETPGDFEQARTLAFQLQEKAAYKDHESKALLPHYNDKYPEIMSNCFKNIEHADDAKFEIVLQLGEAGDVVKIFRNIETNVGLCLFRILQHEQFPRPRVSPYYLHIALDRIAGDVICPSHTILNEKSTPDISVAWCEFSVNGEMIFDGPYVAWWPNGRMGNAGFYEKGVPVGRWMAWYESGSIQAVNTYENGKIVERERFPDINKP